MTTVDPVTLIAETQAAKADVEAINDLSALDYADLGVLGAYLERCALLLYEADRNPDDYDLAAIADACALQDDASESLIDWWPGAKRPTVSLQELIAKQFMAKYDYLVSRDGLYRREDGELVRADYSEAIDDEIRAMGIKTENVGLAMGVRGWIERNAARLAYDESVPVASH
jgi:hypothetical protein